MRGSRDGLALPVLLLLLLALTALAHGTLLLSRQELRASRAMAGAFGARGAAEAVPLMAFRNWGGRSEERGSWSPHLLGRASVEEVLTVEASLRWLDGEFFLLEGIGRLAGWEGQGRRGWVGWSLSPERRVGSFESAAELGGGVLLGPGAEVETQNLLNDPQGWPVTACAPYRSRLDSIFQDGWPGSTGPLAPPLGEELGSRSPLPPLGLLTGGHLLALPQVGSVPEHSPDSVVGCPGHSAPSFLSSSGSLHLADGRFCGVLAVEGDLTLAGSLRLQGLALVGGDLRLEGHAVLEGFTRVGGSLTLQDAARLQASACSVLWSLDGLPRLQRPFLFPTSPLNAF